MSLNASRTRLATVTKELSVQWESTKEHWRDVKAQEFQQKYMEELFGGVEGAMGVIEQLDKLIHKVRSDCE